MLFSRVRTYGDGLILLFFCQVGSLEEDIESLKCEIDKLKGDVRKRDLIINSLKTDIEGLRKEIEERDETIQDKV